MVEEFQCATGGDANDQVIFVCSQVLMDLDEVIASLPCGVIESVHLGFGGKYGNALLQSPNPIEDILLGFTIMNAEALAVLGLCRSEDNVVRVLINGRPIHRGDAEHGLCKLYVYIEKEPGGSRAISLRPDTTSLHCHPVKDMVFSHAIQVSSMVLSTFKRLVNDDHWVTFSLVR
jgi:hypothetical protein